MKKSLLFVLCFICLLTLWGCEDQTSMDTVLVFLEEAYGCTVEDNGQYVAVGEDAVFTLKLDRGCSLTDTDYGGDFDISVSGHTATLIIRAVQYPARIQLHIASRYCAVTYIANGGQPAEGGELQQTKTYDLTSHIRPNTSIGTDLFVREGYTLIGWNTESDGSGEAIGLGSRASVPDGHLSLYAQWAKWSDSRDFTFRLEEAQAIITGYYGADDVVAIPAELNGAAVTGVDKGAFDHCNAVSVVFPSSMRDIAPGAFKDCSLQSVTLFDNIQTVSDSSFQNCSELATLRINAIEAPFGYSWRKESCYADKLDRMILSQDRKRLVFYGGCSMWYNLDGFQAQQMLGDSYAVVNLGLNGTVNSAIQMQIMGAFLQDGDILFHTPELSSRQQLLIHTAMGDQDDKLWCGIENNYDLLALVDLSTVDGMFDSLCHYLSLKTAQTSYAQYYQDEYDQPYIDRFGCIPFFRSGTEKNLVDRVYLDPAFIDENAMDRLEAYYAWFQSQGARVYVSYACINLNAVPEGQRANVALMDSLFHDAMEEMDGVALISDLEDYVYHTSNFFDTNYHLVSQAAKENTALWLRDLQSQMVQDGLWEAP